MIFFIDCCLRRNASRVVVKLHGVLVTRIQVKSFALWQIDITRICLIQNRCNQERITGISVVHASSDSSVMYDVKCSCSFEVD